MQDESRFTELIIAQEELKTLPFGEIWNEYCRVCKKPLDGEWLPAVQTYEEEILEARV